MTAASLRLLTTALGTTRTSGDVRSESAKWGKADIDQVARRFALAAGRERALDANMIDFRNRRRVGLPRAPSSLAHRRTLVVGQACVQDSCNQRPRA